jgi:dihydroneopterin aldolase
VFDIAFELDECDATVTDRIEDTVNYARSASRWRSARRSARTSTLERLCTAVADRLIDRFGAESVRVKATKPEPPIPLPVEEVSVEVWKEDLSRGRLPRPRLERGRPAGEPARRARRARAARGGGRGLVVGLRDRAAGRGLDQPDFLNARLRMRTALGPRSCSTPPRRWSATSAASRAACATGRARSTWTCCCSATSSTARTG